MILYISGIILDLKESLVVSNDIGRSNYCIELKYFQVFPIESNNIAY